MALLGARRPADLLLLATRHRDRARIGRRIPRAGRRGWRQPRSGGGHRAGRPILRLRVPRLGVREAGGRWRGAARHGGERAAFLRLVAGRPADRVRVGQCCVRQIQLSREHRAEQHPRGTGCRRNVRAGDRRTGAQRQPDLGVGRVAALCLQSRRRSRRVSGHPEAVGRGSGPAGAAHHRPQRLRYQPLGGRHTSRIRGVHGNLQRLVGGDRIDRSRVRLPRRAGDHGEPDDRGFRHLPGRPVARVRLEPQRHATDLSRPADRRGAGAAHARLGGCVLSCLVT